MLCLLIDVLSHGNIYKTENWLKSIVPLKGEMDGNLDYHQLSRACFFLQNILRQSSAKAQLSFSESVKTLNLLADVRWGIERLKPCDLMLRK